MTLWRGAILTALVLFLSTTLFSTARTRLECSGRMSTKYGFHPAKTVVNLERHAWAARGLRSDHGSLQLEVPQVAVLHYAVLRDSGDLLEFALGDDPRLGGTFTTGNQELAVRTPQGLFLGACSEVEP